MSRTRSRCTKPLTELIAYLDVQIAELRDELARTKAELEDYRQAEYFGWPIVNARKAAREQKRTSPEELRLVEEHTNGNGHAGSF